MKQREISFQHAVVLGYSEKILVLSVIGSSRYPKTLLTRTNCFHDSFLISIVNLRNSLPDVIQDTDSLLSLKNRLKNIVPVCIRLWCREHPDRQDAAVLILRRRACANPFFFFFFFFWWFMGWFGIAPFGKCEIKYRWKEISLHLFNRDEHLASTSYQYSELNFRIVVFCDISTFSCSQWLRWIWCYGCYENGWFCHQLDYGSSKSPLCHSRSTFK